jgi:3-oxoacyl-[acyl-carrier-protein] synthase II
MALADAKLTADQIDLIGTFGTGVAEYDASESKGLSAALGARYAQVPAIAVKGALGHNGAGSGAIDAAVTLMSLHQNTIPPSLNADGSVLGFVPRGPVDSRARTALCVSYAMHGGQNAALLFKKFQE